MIAQDMQSAVEELSGLIARARVVVPFTGAGISTECGIPDFRSPGGLWTKHAPIPFDQFLSSQDARDETWRRRFAMDQTLSKAKPGRGHLALASGRRWGWGVLSAVLCGAGILTKGPVALVLVLPSLIALRWLDRTTAPMRLRDVFGYGLIA